MHTLTKSAPIQWIELMSRFYTARETLSLQGFPMTDRQLRCLQGIDPESSTMPAPLCSFNIGRMSRGFKARQRLAMVEEAGNAMHCAVIGAVLAWCFAFVDVVSEPIPRPLPAPALAPVLCDVTDVCVNVSGRSAGSGDAPVVPLSTDTVAAGCGSDSSDVCTTTAFSKLMALRKRRRQSIVHVSSVEQEDVSALDAQASSAVVCGQTDAAVLAIHASISGAVCDSTPCVSNPELCGDTHSESHSVLNSILGMRARKRFKTRS